jgi:chromosome segregation ATPase
LMEKQHIIEQQTTELEALREELSGLRDGSGVSQLKDEIRSLNMQKVELETALAHERKDIATKLKDKDETITFLMGELARLKQEQSRGDLNSSNHSLTSLSSLTNLRRGSLNSGAPNSFLPPGLSIQRRGDGSDVATNVQDNSSHRRGSISSILGF